MNVLELTKKIYNDFPKVWKKLEEFLIAINNESKNENYSNDCLNYHITKLKEIVLLDIEKQSFKNCSYVCIIIPFILLYAILDDFFDTISINLLNSNFKKLLGYHSKDKIMTKEIKEKIKYEAVLLSCEECEKE